MRDVAMKLVETLGASLGLDGLSLDEEGCCCIAFDGMPVNFEHEAQSEDLLLIARIADGPSDPSPRYVNEILDLSYTAMLTSGGCLGYDKAAGAIMFADRLPLRLLDEARFERAIENYVDRADGWRMLLTGEQFSRLTSETADLEAVGSMMRI